MGREIKVDFSAGKPAGKGKGGKGGGEVRPMQEKPAGCNTLFAGNLRLPTIHSSNSRYLKIDFFLCVSLVFVTLHNFVPCLQF